MQKSLRLFSLERFDHRLAVGIFVATVLAVFLCSVPSAQQKPLHLNPVIAKLAEGKTVYYGSAEDFSPQAARAAARAPFDYVFMDQEHSPLDFPALHRYVLGMTDIARVLQKGNVQPDVALFARFPTDSGQAGWFVKQALDIGLHGIYFPLTETKEQTLGFIKSMRYPQPRGSKYMEPAGVRGKAGVPLSWGVPAEEYYKHADVWPLNPEGDLLSVMMIESVTGVKNIDAIASVPGVGAISTAGGVDLSTSMGVPQDSPEVEAAFQTILKSCIAHRIPCVTTTNTDTAEGVVKRVREGYSIVRTNAAALAGARRILGVPR